MSRLKRRYIWPLTHCYYDDIATFNVLCVMRAAFMSNTTSHEDKHQLWDAITVISVLVTLAVIAAVIVTTLKVITAVIVTTTARDNYSQSIRRMVSRSIMTIFSGRIHRLNQLNLVATLGWIAAHDVLWIDFATRRLLHCCGLLVMIASDWRNTNT